MKAAGDHARILANMEEILQETRVETEASTRVEMEDELKTERERVASLRAANGDQSFIGLCRLVLSPEQFAIDRQMWWWSK